MPTEVKGFVDLTLQFQREGNKWVGTCVELGTSTFARTLKRCHEELRELVSEHLNALDEVGERERFFKKWNIKYHPTETVQPKELVLRQSEVDFARLSQPALLENGPYFQPGRFPMRGIPEPMRGLVAV